MAPSARKRESARKKSAITESDLASRSVARRTESILCHDISAPGWQPAKRNIPMILRRTLKPSAETRIPLKE
jgi:hypothetical protein